MARKRKFECLIEFWTTPEQFAAFEILQQNGLLTKSDHYRQAFEFYLRQFGAPRPAQPAANGHHHPAVAHG